MTNEPSSSHFVSTDWLAENIGAPDLVVVDGSFVMTDENRDPCAEYLAGHIPGAVFFDIDEIADQTTELPQTLPAPAAFAAAMQELGISDRSRIVVYDFAGLESTARVWWTLRLFGACDAKILAGGLPKWNAEGRRIERGWVSRAPQTFVVRFDALGVADVEDVAAAAKTGAAQILDGRLAARFRGETPERRAGVRSGHIPGSLNLPWRNLIADGMLRERQELEAAFAEAGITWDKPIITTCVSGVSAAVLLLALASLGKTDVRLYDGSWVEWGGRSDLPVERN
ncbi:MAG: 3-mercaptopyruvate sulfurtransferase [Beijerinckiaceae bacterium]